MVVNPFKTIQPKLWGKLQISGQSELRETQRQTLMHNLKACQFEYQFNQRNHYPIITLGIQARLELLCQRCNSPFLQAITSRSTLALSADTSRAIEDSIEEMGLELFVFDDQTRLVDLILEEINLNLPLIAKCPNSCQPNWLDKAKQATTELTQRPFANLREQLKR